MSLGLILVVLGVAGLAVAGYLYFRNSKSARAAIAPAVSNAETQIKNDVKKV